MRAERAKKAQRPVNAPTKPAGGQPSNPENTPVKKETIALSRQEPAPKAEEPAKETVKVDSASVPTETDDEAPTAIQVKTMANMLGRAESKVAPEILAVMTKAHESVKTKAESAKWIMKYREAVR